MDVQCGEFASCPTPLTSSDPASNDDDDDVDDVGSGLH